MKSLFIGLALLACATSAQAAEKWTCSHSAIIDPMSVVVSAPDKPEISRFELTSPDLIYDEHQRRYHIVQNDDDALVAAAAVSGRLDGAGGDRALRLLPQRLCVGQESCGQ